MRRSILATSAALALAAPSALAHQDMADVEITAEEIAPGVAVLFGRGGNMGVSHGEDGTILIDDQFAPLTDKIRAAIAALGASPVEFVINTHWHGDHTGGNENFGEEALIVAHDRVRVRLAEGRAGERPIPPAPKAALPVVTYAQGITFHYNGDTIDVMFLGGGHTDGDSVVFWRNAKVVHMGDLYFKIPGFPFVDTSSGGNVEHLMTSLDAVIARIDETTAVIPGHGPMSNKAELVAYRAFIGEAVDRVKAQRARGLTLEQAIAERPFDNFQRGEGFVSADAFLGAVWSSLDAHD